MKGKTNVILFLLLAIVTLVIALIRVFKLQPDETLNDQFNETTKVAKGPEGTAQESRTTESPSGQSESQKAGD
jgi:uncharacterized protein YpmS